MQAFSRTAASVAFGSSRSDAACNRLRALREDYEAAYSRQCCDKEKLQFNAWLYDIIGCFRQDLPRGGTARCFLTLEKNVVWLMFLTMLS